MFGVPSGRKRAFEKPILPALLKKAHAALYHSAYYLMPYAPGVPTLCTFYDLIPLRYPEYFRPTQRLIYRLTHGLALAVARQGFAISHTTKADLDRVFRLPPNKVVVTPLAADPHFGPQYPTVIAALRRQYPLPAQFGLYVGSNKPHKNLPRLIQALAQAHDALPLVIAGAWEARYPAARQLAEQLQLQTRVVFLGPVPEADLPALYSAAAWFVFPSQYEGFGLPTLEALACGTPVACSDIPVLREVAGDAAHYFDLLDPASLAAALTELSTQPTRRAELQHRGLARAAEFSWERTARQTWQAYQTWLPTSS